MSKFYPGQKVKFIDASGRGHYKAVHGKIYTVEKISDTLMVWTVEGVSAYAYRFASVELDDLVEL